MIDAKRSNKQWIPIKISKQGLKFSHLFYVDDIVLFSKANASNYRTIKNVLDEFA